MILVQACPDEDCLASTLHGAPHVPDGSDHIQCWTDRDRGLKMKESATSIASAVITIFFTGCVIIAHDVSTNFKQSLASLTGHHWISVSVITIVLFVLFSGLLMSSKSARKTLKADDVGLWSTTLIAVTLIMILGILVVIITHFLTD